MNDRIKRMIGLLQRNDWMTGRELAGLLGVSDRTIRSDIKELNAGSSPEIIESSRKLGYRLVRPQEPVFSSNTKSITNLERRKYILKRLVLNKKAVELDRLLEELYISESTLNNDVMAINSYLEEMVDSKIKRSKNQLSLDLQEPQVRRLYKEILLDETNNNIFNISEIASLYDRFDLIREKNLMEGILKIHHYKISDVYYPLFLIHLSIAIDRLISGYGLTELDWLDESIKDSPEYAIALDYFSDLAHRYHIEVPEAETVLLAANMMTKVDNPKKLYTSSVKALTVDLLDYIKNLWEIDFSRDANLIHGLSLHLTALLDRVKQGISSSNVYLEEIKIRYPFIFELAISARDYLNRKLHISISEAEVGYIALHLGTSYGMNFSSKYRTLLIIPERGSLQSHIVGKIRSIFESDLDIVELRSYFEEEDVRRKDIQFVISSVPLQHPLPIPTVLISPFFGDEDEVAIFRAIRKKDHEVLIKEYESNLQELFDAAHFYVEQPSRTRTQVLDFLCQQLVQEGRVEDGYFQEVCGREGFSSTDFQQGFAIPHSITAQHVKESCISVYLPKEPFLWDKYEVSIVFLLSMKNVHHPALKLFFAWIDELASDATKYREMLECKSFEEFMELMNGM